VNVEVTKKQFFASIDFSKNVIDTNISKYNQRKQDDYSKIFNDILIGKVGEFGVYNYLIKKGKVCCPPDLEIYGVINKSFDADLQCESNNIHVKSQEYYASKDFSLSWSFQKEDPLTFKPENQDFIAFTLVKGLNVDVKKIIRANNLTLKYKDPLIDRLKGTKKVIYYLDLI